MSFRHLLTRFLSSNALVAFSSLGLPNIIASFTLKTLIADSPLKLLSSRFWVRNSDSTALLVKFFHLIRVLKARVLFGFKHNCIQKVS
ncbi:hypothetical protein Bca4012_041744 [Brassica carinata]